VPISRKQNARNSFNESLESEPGSAFIVHADEKLSAFVELKRQVLTVTFYLESVPADSCR